MSKQKTITLEICPMFGTPCRHCSREVTHRIYSEFDRDPRTKLSKPTRQGKTRVELGAFCNDAGKWIAGMHYCPVIWGNSQLKRYIVKKEVKNTRVKKSRIVKKCKPHHKKPTKEINKSGNSGRTAPQTAVPKYSI